MARKLKVLVLVVGVVCAFSAVSASSAMAATEPVASLHTQAYESTLTGTQEGLNHKFTFFGGTAVLECTSSHFDGVGNLTAPTTELLFTPTYSGCATKIGKETNPTTITHNGCKFKFTVHEEVAGSNGNEWTGDMDLICPTGNFIEIHLFQNEEKHINNEPKCTYKAEPQTVTGIKYKNNIANADVSVEANEAPVTFKRISGTLVQCGAVEQVAKYTGNITVDANDLEGKITENIIIKGM